MLQIKNEGEGDDQPSTTDATTRHSGAPSIVSSDLQERHSLSPDHVMLQVQEDGLGLSPQPEASQSFYAQILDPQASVTILAG